MSNATWNVSRHGFLHFFTRDIKFFKFLELNYNTFAQFIAHQRFGVCMGKGGGDFFPLHLSIVG